MVKITQAFDWHIEGEIVETDMEPMKVDEDYVNKMKEDL